VREDRGIAIGIAAVAALSLAALPFLLPTTIWIVLTVYAIVKAAGSAPVGADPAAVVLSIVGIVTLFTLAIAGAVALLGRAMTPKKKRRRDRDELAVADA
jgi:hypothetical protein